MPKRKRRKREREKLIDWVSTIEHWDWGYSLSVADRKYHHEPYYEFQHLKANASLMYPRGLNPDAVSIWILSSIDMNRENRANDKSIGVGSLHLNSTLLQCWLTIPDEALSDIVRMFTAGRIRYLQWSAPSLYFGKALIKRFSFRMNLDYDEIIVEDYWAA